MNSYDLDDHVRQLSLEEAVDIQKWIADLEATVKDAPVTERTHYEKLNEFLDPVYDFIHTSLRKFGFISGDQDKNRRNHPAMIIWWVYGEVGNCIYRYPCIDSSIVNVACHHASSFHRQQAILNSIKLLKAFMTYHHGINSFYTL